MCHIINYDTLSSCLEIQVYHEFKIYSSFATLPDDGRKMCIRDRDENYAKARRAFLVGYDRSVPKLRQANHCTGCEQCNPHCPQGIDIPKEMQRIDKFVEELKVNG